MKSTRRPRGPFVGPVVRHRIKRSLMSRMGRLGEEVAVSGFTGRLPPERISCIVGGAVRVGVEPAPYRHGMNEFARVVANTVLRSARRWYTKSAIAVEVMQPQKDAQRRSRIPGVHRRGARRKYNARLRA